MNTQQIANLANLDGVGSGLDLQLILRTVTIMEYLSDIGDARWRRVNATLSLVANDRTKNLPDDFYRMIDIKIPPVGATQLCEKDSLRYIGEDSNLVLQSEFSTTVAKPVAYYIVPRSSSTDTSFRAIKFSETVDASYTAYYVYLRGPVFADLTSNVDMNNWIPELLQPGLVEGLRKRVLLDRYGQRDARYGVADAAYREWVQRAKEGKDSARRNYAVSVN